MAEDKPFISDEKSIQFSESENFMASTFQNDDNYDNSDGEQYYNDIFKKLVYSDDYIYFFICEKCKKCPLLKFDNDFLYNLKDLEYSCDCQKSEGENKNNKYTKTTLEEFKKNFGMKNFNKIIEFQDFFMCSNHHKFSGYLKDVNKDICSKCMIKKENNINEENYIQFEEHVMYKRIVYLINIFKLYENDKDDKDDKDDKNDKNDEPNEKIKIKKFISKLIVNYIKFRNYNIYQTLINLESSIIESKNKASKDNLFLYYLTIIKPNDLRKITDDKNLLPYVTEVQIKSTNIDSLKLLTGFHNLKRLDLRSNCIINIESLENASFENLEFLNLSTNKIGNDCIKHFENCKLKNLTYLNLDLNCITDYRIFFALSKKKDKDTFGKLTKLFICFNVFNCLSDDNGKIINKKQYKEYFENISLDFNSIEILHLTHGVFNKNTIKLIFPCFELNEIREIKLAYNNLNNYSFLLTKDKCQWFHQLINDIRNKETPKVEKIILKKGNYIKDINFSYPEINKYFE